MREWMVWGGVVGALGIAITSCTKPSRPDEPVDPSESPYRVVDFPDGPYGFAWLQSDNPHLAVRRIWAMITVYDPTLYSQSTWVASSEWTSPGWILHADIMSVDSLSSGNMRTEFFCNLGDETLLQRGNILIRVFASGGFSIVRSWPEGNYAIAYGCSPSGLIVWVYVSFHSGQNLLTWSQDGGQTWEPPLVVSDSASIQGAGRVHPDDGTFWFTYGTMVVDGVPARVLRFHPDTRTLDTVWVSRPEDSLLVLDLIPAPSNVMYGVVYEAGAGLPGSASSKGAWIWKFHADGGVDTLVDLLTLSEHFAHNVWAVPVNGGDLYLFPMRYPTGDPLNLNVPLVAYRLSPDGSVVEVEFPPVPEKLLPPRANPEVMVYGYTVSANPQGEHWMFRFTALQENMYSKTVTLQFDGRPTLR